MKLTLTAAFLLAANYGWGSSFCTTAPSYTEVGSYGSSTSAGCYVADKTFSDFALDPGQSDVYVAGAESGYTNGLGAYEVSALFSGSAAGGPWSAGPDGQVMGVFTFVADSANTYGFDTTYPTLPIASLITSITLSGAGDVPVGSNSNLIEAICIGAGACNVGDANSIELYGEISGTTYTGECNIFGQVTGATCSPNESTVTFSSAVTSVSVWANFDLYGPTTTGIASIDYIEDTFGEEGIAPEPSTFVLLGSALVGLAALRFRKRS